MRKHARLASLHLPSFQASVFRQFIAETGSHLGAHAVVWVVLAVLLASLAAPRHASAQKTTIDPNVPGTRSAQVGDSTDKRVAQKITYNAKRKPVREILGDLGELTGVKLYAGYNSKDWQVRDRRMNVFVKDLPLAHLMNSIARVMKFKWKRNEQLDPCTYRLYMDRRTLLGAEAQRLREEERINQDRVENVERMLNDFSKLDNLSEEELEQLKEDNPYLYVLATTGVGGSLGAFFNEVPAAAEALAAGQELTLSGARLSTAGQQAALRAAKALARLQSITAGESTPLPEDVPDNLEEATIHLNPFREMMATGPVQNVVLGDLWILYDRGPQIVGVLLNPESEYAKFMGKVFIRSREENRDWVDVAKDLEGEAIQLVASETKKQDFGEPLADHVDHPALQVKAKLEVESNELHDVQEALAKAASLSVVSDSFMPAHGYPPVTRQEAELKEILDQIATAYYYNWFKHASVIEFRDRYWYKKRTAQIPQDWIDGWTETLKKTGTLDIADLAQISMLTHEQLMANIQPDEHLSASRVVDHVYIYRRELRMYASLTEIQRALLFSESGLNLALLGPNQWPCVERLINAKNGTFLQNPDAQLTLGATRTPRGKVFAYAFTLTTTDELEPITWRILETPSYRPPETKAKKEAQADIEKGPLGKKGK